MNFPSIKPKKIVKALKKINFEEIRQSGSHLILANKGTVTIISVPMHNKDIKQGLLRSIIRQSGLTPRQFQDLL